MVPSVNMVSCIAYVGYTANPKCSICFMRQYTIIGSEQYSEISDCVSLPAMSTSKDYSTKYRVKSRHFDVKGDT